METERENLEKEIVHYMKEAWHSSNIGQFSVEKYYLECALQAKEKLAKILENGERT